MPKKSFHKNTIKVLILTINPSFPQGCYILGTPREYLLASEKAEVILSSGDRDSNQPSTPEAFKDAKYLGAEDMGFK